MIIPKSQIKIVLLLFCFVVKATLVGVFLSFMVLFSFKLLIIGISVLVLYLVPVYNVGSLSHNVRVRGLRSFEN